MVEGAESDKLCLTYSVGLKSQACGTTINLSSFIMFYFAKCIGELKHDPFDSDCVEMDSLKIKQA